MIHSIPGSILSKYAQNIDKGLKISVYGDTYLQQNKLELVQDMVHNYHHYSLIKRTFYSQWGTTLLIYWTFFSPVGLFANSCLLRFAHLASLCLSCQLPLMSVFLLHLKTGQDLLALKQGRGKAQLPSTTN